MRPNYAAYPKMSLDTYRHLYFPRQQTHESYIQAVADIVCNRLADEADRVKCQNIKLAYGAGQAGLRGVTYYNRWTGKIDGNAPFVEVCAFGQESIVQLAGTTIHELGHVLAGWGPGHGPEWKAACAKLGLRRIKAAGTQYTWALFEPDIREAIYSLPQPTDGKPSCELGGYIGKRKVAAKPCTQGFGTKGGKSRGVGSGSRLRKYTCEGMEGHKPVIIRAATDSLDCTCNVCHTSFRLNA